MHTFYKMLSCEQIEIFFMPELLITTFLLLFIAYNRTIELATQISSQFNSFRHHLANTFCLLFEPVQQNGPLVKTFQ